MNALIYLLAYACIVVFVGAVAWRVYRLSSMPVHLRWELYPVGHEPANKRKYGGSYLEHVDWWDQPSQSTKIGGLMVMLPEIILLKGVWHANRPLWYVSFPFHFGLYVMMATVAAVMFGGVLTAFGVSVAADGPVAAQILYYLTILGGYVGYTLGFVGSIGLLIRRLTDPALKDYSALLDYVNLVFFIVALGLGLAAFLFVDSNFSLMRTYFAGLVTFQFAPLGSGLVAVTLAAGMALMAYIPLTHMSHFFTKYFMWDLVRWDDEPNHPGSALEKKIQTQLARKPTWAAAHLGADGQKNWGDLATSNPHAKEK